MVMVRSDSPCEWTPETERASTAAAASAPRKVRGPDIVSSLIGLFPEPFDSDAFGQVSSWRPRGEHLVHCPGTRLSALHGQRSPPSGAAPANFPATSLDR